jgi:heme exporter protein D
MQFDSISAALSMDGHGAYVWFVFVAALLVAVGLLVIPTLRHRRIARDQRGAIRRQQTNAVGDDNAPSS